MPNWFKTFSGSGVIKHNLSVVKKQFDATKTVSSDTFNETFDEALERFGVNIENRDERANFIFDKYKNFNKMSMVAFVFSILCAVVFVFYLINANYFSAFFVFSVSLLVFVNFISYSFRCYQMRKQSLCLFKEFLKQPKEWPPKKIESSSFFK